MRKLLSVILSLAFVFSLFATMSFSASAENDVYYSSNYGYIIETVDNVDYATIVEYTGAGPVASLPSTLDGYPVTKIGAGAFQNNTSIQVAHISSSIHEIGDYAFAGCTNLSVAVIYKSGLQTVGANAFINCPSLSLQLVGSAIPQFTITGTENNFSYSLYNDFQNYGYGFCAHITGYNSYDVVDQLIIPDTILGIPVVSVSGISNRTTIYEVYLPDSINVIQPQAFKNLYNLYLVHYPNSSFSIGSQAFANCTGLSTFEYSENTNITYTAPDAFENAGTSPHYYRDGDYRYSKIDNDTAVSIAKYLGTDTVITVPATIANLPVKEIAYNSFNNATITSVTLPASVTKIEGAAFSGCNNLSGVTVADTYRSATIGLSNRTITVNVSDEDDVNSVSARFANGASYSITLTSSDPNEYSTIVVEGVGTNSKVTVSASAGDYTFTNCDNATITVDGVAYENLVDLSNATATLDYTSIAYNGTARTPAVTVTLGETTLVPGTDYSVYYSDNINVGTASVRIAGKGAYMGTINLTFSILPAPEGVYYSSNYGYTIETVDNVDYATIVDYTGAGPVASLPSTLDGYTVKKIGAGAFQGNTDIQLVHIPNCYRSIGASAFAGCTNLSCVIFYVPGIQTIGANAFSNCPSLSLQMMGSGYPNFTITGTEGHYSYSIYYDLQLGTGFSAHITGYNGYTTSSLHIPDSILGFPVVSIAGFSANSSIGNPTIAEVYLPDTLKVIKAETFKNDINLYFVHYPNGSFSIESLAFANCERLTTLEYSENTVITSEAPDAFYNAGTNPYIYMSSATATLDYTRVAYDGTAKTPAVTVTVGDTTLRNRRDYTVSYSDNTDVGTASVSVVGCGNYKGVIDLTFEILPSDFLPGDLDGDGAATSVDVVLLKKVIAGNTIQYIPYNADVNGDGSYNALDLVNLKNIINANPNMTSLENADVTLEYTRVAYDGTPKTPVATVVVDNITLVAGTDYEIYYSGNVNEGTADITIAGKGAYKGFIYTEFEILPANFLPGDVNGDGEVNALDITAMRQYIAGALSIDQIVRYNADINNDDCVNARDLTLLREMIAA